MPAKCRYNAQYHDDWAWSLAIKGATNDEIAEAFHISLSTFTNWLRDPNKKSLHDAVFDGKNIADAKVERSLYRRACGMTTKEEERVIQYDGDGNVLPVTVKTKIKENPPDTMAAMYWLNNRQRRFWSQRQEISVETQEKTDDVIIYLPQLEGENGGDESEKSTSD